VKRIISAGLLALFSAALGAQTTHIVGTTIVGADGAALQYGQITMQPVDANGNPINVRVGSGGLMVARAAVCLISGGAITTALNGTPCTAVDTTLSDPANFCYKTTIRETVSGWTAPVLPCVQPSGTTWSFNTYIPGPSVTAMVIAGPAGPAGPAGTSGGAANWRGAWTATTAYAKNDAYTEGGNGYVVTTAYTSGSTFGSTDTSNSLNVSLFNGGTITNPLIARAVTGSVNMRLNLAAPPYSADSNCTTGSDDQAAFIAAESDAKFWSPPAIIELPRGCYLTSTIPFKGVSMEGQAPVGVNPAYQSAGTVIMGKPGQDVMEMADPTTITGSAYPQSWSLSDIVFQVDDTVDVSGTGSFVNRWPGRWVQDAAMTSGSAVFTSPNAIVGCGDVGQAIQVNGAGASGGNLVTTIASVSPCETNYGSATPSWLTVTLAAAASTTVSAASAYISIAGLPVTAQIGNAGFAADCKDGNSAHWTATGSPGINGVLLTNVKFYALHNQNHTVGLYTQGCYAPYDFTANHVSAWGTVFGVVFAPPALDAYAFPGLQDKFRWVGGYLESPYPWISYNGSQAKLEDIQIYTGTGIYGPQIMDVGNVYGDFTVGWTINNPEMEGPGSGFIGYRIEGADIDVSNTALGGNLGGTVGPIWEASDSTCRQCNGYGTMLLAGSRNNIEIVSGAGAGPALSVVNAGAGNQVTGRGYEQSPLHGEPSSRKGTLTKAQLDQPVGIETTDFIRGGNVASPYPNDNDLIFTPHDIDFGGYLEADELRVVPDASARYGDYFAWPNGANSAFYSLHTQNSGGNAIIGAQIPPTQASVYVSAKCPTSTSFTVTAYAGSTSLGSGTATCSATSYNQAEVKGANFAAYSGQSFTVSVSTASSDAEVEYVGLRVYQANYNDYQPASQATTVNGHPLSSNVTVSASDINTGTLPHAQLPALTSADIPPNAANTTGIAGGISGDAGTVTSTTGTTTTAHTFSTAFSSTPNCVAAPLSNAGAWYFSTPASTTSSGVITYATSGAQTFSEICSGPGGAW
jgi:hypothetical protein